MADQLGMIHGAGNDLSCLCPTKQSPALSHARRRWVASGPSSLVTSRMPTRRDMTMTAFSATRGQDSLSDCATLPMIVSRFAPSPTGRLHLGHAYSAVARHAAARDPAAGFLLRIEDLDQGRSRPEFVAGNRGRLALAWARLGRRAARPVEASAVYSRSSGAAESARGWSTPASAPAPTSPRR
jgi:hypothetical protein